MKCTLELRIFFPQGISKSYSASLIACYHKIKLAFVPPEERFKESGFVEEACQLIHILRSHTLSICRNPSGFFGVVNFPLNSIHFYLGTTCNIKTLIKYTLYTLFCVTCNNYMK